MSLFTIKRSCFVAFQLKHLATVLITSFRFNKVVVCTSPEYCRNFTFRDGLIFVYFVGFPHPRIYIHVELWTAVFIYSFIMQVNPQNDVPFLNMLNVKSHKISPTKINDFKALWFINVHVVKIKSRTFHLSFIIYLNFIYLVFVCNIVRQAASLFFFFFSQGHLEIISNPMSCVFQVWALLNYLWSLLV